MNYEQHKIMNSLRNNEFQSLFKIDQSNLNDTAYRKIRYLVNENSKLKQLLENNYNNTRELIKHNHRIISIIAHDLRSPYNSVLNVLEFLLKNFSSIDKEALSQYLNVLKTSTIGSLEMLDNMIHWSIVNNYPKLVELQPVDLHRLTEKIFSSYKFIASKKNVALHNMIEEFFEISADQNIIETILRNLIDNAVHYNKDNGIVEVSAISKHEHYDIIVRDTGIGFNSGYFDKNPEHSLKTISFEPKSKSKGLGLLIVNDLVQLHGASISFTKNQDHGTTVTLQITKKNSGGNSNKKIM